MNFLSSLTSIMRITGALLVADAEMKYYKEDPS